MKITDLFKQDILNPKPVLIREYGVTTERTSSLNSEAILLTLLFGLTAIIVTSKQITYGTARKEN